MKSFITHIDKNKKLVLAVMFLVLIMILPGKIVVSFM